MEKIGIILTMIERDKAFFMALKSIINTMQDNWMVIAGYQAKNKVIEFSHPQIYTYSLPYNYGISSARNDMIIKAVALGCDYVLLTADSIRFNESMKDIKYLAPCFNKYDLIGLQLDNRVSWEAKLNLIEKQSFELDFITKNQKDNIWNVGDKVFNVWDCDIVRNFWLAKTEAITKVPYDEQLVACEHEDFFWRFKGMNWSVGCTNLCSGTYEKPENTPKYDEIRSTNFRIGRQRLLNKYSLKGWVSYKNLENTKL